ncbi:VOC family protein [Phenylobacterium sp.]|uniref:VOC family protein n=1 Tax=Phenylobacterium sp. TaxID=1871053 RepID=UPI003BAB1472
MEGLRLAHYAVRAADLEASRRFYVEVLGLRVGPRPAFAFPGLWLYAGPDESRFGVVHLIGAGVGLQAYLGDGSPSQDGTGAMDHVAFLAADWPSQRRRCRGAGIDYVERTAPGLGLLQVFLRDPDGVTVELNYPAAETFAASPLARSRPPS